MRRRRFGTAPESVIGWPKRLPGPVGGLAVVDRRRRAKLADRSARPAGHARRGGRAARRRARRAIRRRASRRPPIGRRWGPAEAAAAGPVQPAAPAWRGRQSMLGRMDAGRAALVSASVLGAGAARRARRASGRPGVRAARHVRRRGCGELGRRLLVTGNSKPGSLLSRCAIAPRVTTIHSGESSDVRPRGQRETPWRLG